MPRRTRKQMVGKVENADLAENARKLNALQRLVRREWWSQRRGQIPAYEVLPLRPYVERDQQEK